MNETLTALREQHAVDAHASRMGDAEDPALTMTNPSKGTDILDRPGGSVAEKGTIP